MSFLFTVPTIMGRPKLEIANVENIANQFPESKVYFVSNTVNEHFSSYKPVHSNIIKEVSNKKFSISKALNVGLSNFTEDFFIFVQSDMYVDREAILLFKELYSKIENVGVIGVTKHSGFNTFSKNISFPGTNVFKVLWADGIMFIPRMVFEQVGYFNEDYLGDKESQEYCYRTHNLGFNNLFIQSSQVGRWAHKGIEFSKKVDRNYNQEFLNSVTQSRALFNKRWAGWEQDQKKLFK